MSDDTLDPGDPAGEPSTSCGECESVASPTHLDSPRPSLSSDISPSTSEERGLLSLPFEILAHIASQLPAQCVIDVLPKVCQVLGNVANDSTSWQLRARKVIGSRAGFPVGPRENFDWPAACVEMEELITCWTGGVHHVAKQIREEEEQRSQEGAQQRAGQDGRLAAEGEEQVDGVRVAAQEVVYGADEGMDMDGDDGEMGVNLEMGFREGAIMEEEQNHRMVFNAQEQQFAFPNLQELMLYPRNQNNERQAELPQHQSLRSPSPPSTALEFFTLPSAHIAHVNSVLLLGGEGAVCATASRDWNVKLWDLQESPNGTERHNLLGQGEFNTHRGWVWCMASQGSLLATGGFDKTVRLWDLQAAGAARGRIGTGAAVLCLSCQPDVLLVGTFDKRITMYDTRAGDQLVESLSLHVNAVMCLAADDKFIFSGSKDCTVCVYDRRAAKVLKKIRLKSYLLSMSYSGSEVWAGDNMGRLHCLSMHNGVLNPPSQFNVGHTALITGIHRTSGSLYTCSSDGTIKVHIPCAPPRTLCTLDHRAGINGLSVEAGVLAAATGDLSVEIWRPRK
ncbi:F-box/WD repeat-containing protein 9 [Gouania willdenowi]|uniref:F-box domain-containing protein n=1 Tax=Gouania willdenowi TaxID=441366 RepID=A0A8C5E347_GOUWI|nr:F-box/WD repeat-containing protein 9 [Gouania willdenowi]XP_028311446.1 F-box/WD repeat-containing protein 9 [Gouania willdenowi]